MTSFPVDRRRARGAQTRHDVLRAAADLASLRGIEAVTLGALGETLQMSKSGIVKHFGSREQLQLATIDYAATVFADVVLGSAQGQKPGLHRLRSTVRCWLDYLTGSTFSGGCFFHASAAELDCQPGPLRDAVVSLVRAGLALLREDLVAAVGAGELNRRTDVDQVLFELHGHLMEVSFAHLLLEDPTAHDRGARAIKGLLDRWRPDPQAAS